jgi:protein-tyrosine sulfotransferase
MTSSNSEVNRIAILSRDIQKYFALYFERSGFTNNLEPPEVGEPAKKAARSIRGKIRDPAILIHGIMPRSGTVYVGELLKLHPDLHDYPYKMWEVPALQMSPHLARLGRKFLLEYKPNIGKFGENELLPLFGASMIAYLQDGLPSNGRLLMKVPSVQYITHFFSMFPHEYLLLLIRDGRDVVHTTLRTWPRLNFIQVCLRWNRSAQAILQAIGQFNSSQKDQYLLMRFEDALAEPEAFVKRASTCFGLNPKDYPFDEIDSIKVIGSSKLTKPGEAFAYRWAQRPEGFRPMDYWQRWPAIRKYIFKAIAGKSLMDLGYCRDLDW